MTIVLPAVIGPINWRPGGFLRGVFSWFLRGILSWPFRGILRGILLGILRGILRW